MIFSVATLDLLMYAFLHFPFEDPSPCWLIIFSDFEDVCGIDVIVASSPHDMGIVHQQFVDRDLPVLSVAITKRSMVLGLKEAKNPVVELCLRVQVIRLRPS